MNITNLLLPELIDLAIKEGRLQGLKEAAEICQEERNDCYGLCSQAILEKLKEIE